MKMRKSRKNATILSCIKTFHFLFYKFHHTAIILETKSIKLLKNYTESIESNVLNVIFLDAFRFFKAEPVVTLK